MGVVRMSSPLGALYSPDAGAFPPPPRSSRMRRHAAKNCCPLSVTVTLRVERLSSLTRRLVFELGKPCG